LITAPDPESGDAVMVNLTTQQPHSDTTTIIQPGEHPFVDRPTVVFYADARIVDVKNLEAALRQGVVRRHAPLSAELLASKTISLSQTLRPTRLKRHSKSRVRRNLRDPPQNQNLKRL
jgi:hypothetical protein